MHPLAKVSEIYTGYFTEVNLSSDENFDNYGNPVITPSVFNNVKIKLMLKPISSTINLPNVAGGNSANSFVECFVLKPKLDINSIPDEIFLDNGRKLIVVSRTQSLLKAINKIFGTRFIATMN